MGKDHVGRSRVARGCYGRVVIAPQEPAAPVEPESLDAAVDRQVCSIVDFEHAVMELSPSDVTPHQPVGETVVAPKGIAEEVHQVEPIPLYADGGILQMLPRIGALLDDHAIGRG